MLSSLSNGVPCGHIFMAVEIDIANVKYVKLCIYILKISNQFYIIRNYILIEICNHYHCVHNSFLEDSMSAPFIQAVVILFS